MSFSEFPYSCRITRNVEVVSGTYPSQITTTSVKTLYNGVCDIQLNDGLDRFNGLQPQNSNYIAMFRTPIIKGKETVEILVDDLFYAVYNGKTINGLVKYAEPSQLGYLTIFIQDNSIA